MVSLARRLRYHANTMAAVAEKNVGSQLKKKTRVSRYCLLFLTAPESTQLSTQSINVATVLCDGVRLEYVKVLVKPKVSQSMTLNRKVQCSNEH